MIICDKESCTGCMVCASICNKNAISPVADDHGFIHPFVDEFMCVNCGRCSKACPVNLQEKHEKTEQIYACWQLDVRKRFEATSGGAFMAMAEKFVDDGGVVYGAAFDDDYVVRHVRVDNRVDLIRLRGSKYVQSVTCGIFENVKADLHNHIRVLFSGTPCQVSALKNYLGKAHAGLYTIDIVCHGVPSPMVFKDYLAYIKAKHPVKIESVNFRYKKPGWSVFSMRILFADAYEYVASKFKDPYLYFFLAGGGDLTLRRSCFQCRFTSPERVGDVTLGDFWGFQAFHYSQRSVESGVGLVLLNSDKGKELFHPITNQFHVERQNWAAVHASNKSFREPWSKPDKFDAFWDYYNRNGFESAMDVFYDAKVARDEEALRKKGAWKRAHAYFLPWPIRKVLKATKALVKKRLKR